MPAQFILYESASGYALFEIVEAEEIGSLKDQVQESVVDFSRFSQIVKFKAFQPFTSAENALQNINDISEGIVTEDLHNFLESNLPKAKPGKKPKFVLGVIEPKIGTAVQESLSVPCNSNETILEIVRGCRLHLEKFIKGLEGASLLAAQLGLSHSYSRAKVKFNVNRADNMIIQAICLLDQLDKDLNTNAMRIKEWYGWHFPELAKILNDNYIYARVAQFIGKRGDLTEDKLEQLTELTMDETVSRQVLDAARASMGMEMSDIDMINVRAFTDRLVALGEYRKQLSEYLNDRMGQVAPNLGALIGETVGARLISHAGSLTNLAKAPASTVQILGAEKALFRALKTRGNTPKYGLIFHSSFIGRAAARNKGRISRYLANKCSIAARIDSFADYSTSTFGEKLRDQVEERLAFYESGEAPRRNVEVMQEAIKMVKPLADAAVSKRATSSSSAAAPAEADSKSKKSKKEKKEKKEKKSKKAEEAPVEKAKRKRGDSDDEPATPAQKSSKKQKTTDKKKSKKSKKDKA